MTKGILSSVDLFSFTSYQSYFQALAEAWTNQGRSMKDLAKSCGFSSPNFVQQLINGKRNLTQAAADKVATNLELKETGRQYLMALVRLSQAKDANESSSIMRRMKRLVGQAKRRSIVDTSIFDHWLYGIVFEMFKLDHIRSIDHLEGAALRIGVTTQKLHQAFDFLVQRGYLKQTDDAWSPADVEFQPQNDVRKINSQQNHLKFFVLAQHRISDELMDREFQGLTFAARESRLPELKERIRAFVRTINDEFAEDSGGDQVMRLQLGLFKILK